MQLRPENKEAREEWRRRHPKVASQKNFLTTLMSCADTSGTRITHLLLCRALATASARASNAINIELKNGTDVERETKVQLERLLKSYDLQKYTFTRHMLIDEQDTPHSHPVLTLHARHNNSDDLLLSTYVHEQLH